MKCDASDPEAVVDETMVVAARAFHIPYRSAISSGHRKAVGARAATMVYATFEVGHTLEDVADAMDMDHSTVAYHRGRHEARLRDDAMLNAPRPLADARERVLCPLRDHALLLP